MSKFDVTDYGVSAIDAQDAKAINGGVWWGLPFVIGLLLGELNDSNCASDFEQGRQAARSFWGK